MNRLLALVLVAGLALPAYARGPVEPAGEAKPVTPAVAKPVKAPAKPVKASAKPVKAPANAATAAAVKAAEAALKAKVPAPKKILHPAEVTYRHKADGHGYTLHVRPGYPKPGETVALVVDVAKLHDPPDPTYGSSEPIRGADLVVKVEKDGKGPTLALHPMGDPGRYGAHITFDEPGLYTVRMARRSGKPGLSTTFPLGVGVPTPARPDDVLAALPRAGQHHGPVVVPGAARPSAGPALPRVMHKLGRKLLAEDAALHGKGDAAAIAQAMVELSRAIAGQTPPFAASRPKEFDAEAAHLTQALKKLAASPSPTALKDVERNHCWRCHAQFRWGVASDVSAWPSFTQAREVK